MVQLSRDIRGIAFDSGGTLVSPLGGAWLPGVAFHATLARRGLSAPDPDELAAGLAQGAVFLDAHHSVQTLADEVDQFTHYYDIVLRACGISAREVASEIAHGLVHEVNFEPYPETRRVLHALEQQQLRLSIVSDAWPSLRVKYEKLGLAQYFRGFAISSQLGCCKPDERMYRAALATLELPPSQVLFVDDFPDLVAAAIELGMHGVVLLRQPAQCDAAGLPALEDLDELTAALLSGRA